MTPTKELRPGIGVDRLGGPVVDPTKNVLDLVAAQQKRLDDLSAAETRRLDQLAAAETRRIDQLAKQRDEYERELRVMQERSVDIVRSDLSGQLQAQILRLTDSDIRIERRLAALERFQAEGAGRGEVRDPLFEQLSVKLDSLLQTRSMNTGQVQGSAATWAAIIAAISLLGTLVALARTFIQ